MESSDREAKKANIKQLFAASATSKRTAPGGASVRVRGNGNVVAAGDVTIHTTQIIQQRPKPVVKTGDGVLTAQQKGELRKRVGEWVQLHGELKKSPMSWARAWAKVNGHVGVNSYHEIPQEQFGAAVRYIQVEMGKLNAMPSARKKSPEWRNKRIAAIHARCKQRDLVEWRIQHMEKTFGRTSMVELDDTELEQLYRAVFAKKK